MSYQVDLTSRAERDVDGILAWLHERSPQGAATWYRRWQQVLSDLASHGETCQLAPENADHDDEIRHLVFKTRRGRKYRAIFVIRGTRIFVVHVRGPGQDLIAPDQMHLPE